MFYGETEKNLENPTENGPQETHRLKKMGENRAIFQDTLALCNTNKILKDSIEYTTSSQIIYYQNEKIPLTNPKKRHFPSNFSLKITKNRTLESAYTYAKSGHKVSILNFMNFFYPGGLVKKGKESQEESLCRSTTLQPCLSHYYLMDNFYTRNQSQPTISHNDDVIYSPGIVIFKDEKGKLLKEKKWAKINVISASAPCLNEYYTKSKIHATALLEIHERKAKRILDTAVLGGNDVVVLGAFGCGDKGNDPTVVASAYKNVLEYYGSCFQVVEFAIWGEDEGNYKVFRDVLGGCCCCNIC